MRNGLTIKFFCRSFDLRLYEQSRRLYEQAGYECVRLTDCSADGYLYSILKHTDCDIAVNVDEDCFLTDLDAVFRLVDYVLAHGYVNAGCPDGGGGARYANPIVTNPFFNVLNLRMIRQQGTVADIKRKVAQFDYQKNKQAMSEAYPQELLQQKYNFSATDIEPYYPFLLWLAFSLPTLYLHSERHSDGVSTVLYNHLGERICLHTWYARFYSVPSFIVKHFQPNAGKQQKRIDAVIAEAYSIREMKPYDAGRHAAVRYAADKTVRWLIKIPQRIYGWRRKIIKRLNRRKSQ